MLGRSFVVFGAGIIVGVVGARFLLSHPQAKHFLATINANTDGKMSSLILHDALVSDFQDECVEVYDWPDGLQRPVSPGLHVLVHRVRYLGNQVWRNLRFVELLQMTLDFADGHAASVERENSLIEPFKSGLPLLHQLGLEGA